MTFPTNPTNGQSVTLNGVELTYNSTKTAWVKTTSGSGTVPATVSGTLSVTGNANVGNLGTNTAIITTGNITTLNSGLMQNGNSNISVDANSHVRISANGTANVFFIAANGNVGVGNAAPGHKLSVTGSQFVSVSIGVGTAPSGTTGEIRATGNITAGFSDIRLKEVIGPIENALDKIDNLTGIVYTQSKLAEQFGYNDYSKQVGLSAQDVEKVQPEVVKPAPFDLNANNQSISGDNYLTVNYERLVPLLIEGIKELRKEIKKLKGEI